MHGSQIPGVFRICIQRRRSNDPVGKQSKADRCQPSKQMITRAYYKYTSTGTSLCRCSRAGPSDTNFTGR